MVEKFRNNILKNNYFLSNNIMNVQNIITQNRRRGRPSKPSKTEIGIKQLEEIPIENYVKNIYKGEIIHLFKNNQLTFKTGQKLINTLPNLTEKKTKSFLHKLEKYSLKKSVKEKNQFKKIVKLEKEIEEIEEKSNNLKRKRLGKPFIINVLLYRLPVRDEDETKEQFEARIRKMKMYQKTYQQIGALSLTVDANEKTLERALHKLVEREELLTTLTKELFNEMMMILRTNDKFNRPEKKDDKGKPIEVFNYIDAIYLHSYLPDMRKDKMVMYSPMNIKAQNSQQCVSMYNKYISTPIDITYDNLQQAIENKNYIVNECWINTLMEYYGETILSPIKSDRYRITREKLLNILNVSEDTIKNGLSIEDVVPFFEKFRLQLKVFNEIGKLIFKYVPKIPNSVEKRCYTMLKGNHIYTINRNLEKLRLRDILEITEDDNKKYLDIYTPSSNYYINEEREPIPAIMIETVDEIPKILEDELQKEIINENITLVLKDNDMEKCCIELIEKCHYTPKIKFQGNRLTDIFLNFTCEKHHINIKIQTQHLVKSEFDGVVCVNDENVYNNMNVAMCNFNKALFLNNHKSSYSEKDIEILDEYRTVANCGTFSDKTEWENIIDNIVEIDVSKAYTHALSQITEIPIFNIFDNFENYNNQPIENLSLYIIETDKQNLFLNKKYNLCYGIFLKKIIKHKNIKILAVKTPSFIKQVKYNELIENLYETKISDTPYEDTFIKKQIVNVNIGLLEKSENKSVESFLYTTLDEAEYYRSLYGGTIHTLQQIKMEDELDGNCDDPLDEGLDGRGDYDYNEIPDNVKCPQCHHQFHYDDEGIESDEWCGKCHCPKCENLVDNIDDGVYNMRRIQKYKTNITQIGQTYYVLNIKQQTTLINGFRYIKELILQHHNYKMFRDAKTLTKNNINIYSVKTDALTILDSDVDKVQTLINFSSERGGWRLSKTEQIIFPSDNLQVINNSRIEITPLETTRLEVKDEYDTDEICSLFEKHKTVMVRAEYGGSGKSYACANMAKLGYNVLFVSPTNVLCRELSKGYNIESITINKLFGFNAEGETKHMKVFDVSEYNCIIFDEIYFYNVSNLIKVNNFVKTYTNKIILATGDVEQLEAIDNISNVKNYEEYINHCINSIFPYDIFLTENKRLRTEEDKLKLKNMKYDILKTNISVIDIIKKYNFKMTNKVITEDNIAYTNAKCNAVSKEVRKMLGRKDEYEKGEKLVCRKFFKCNGNNINKNFEYIIDDVNNETITLRDENTDETMKLKIQFVDEHFIHYYCNTCHSRQGSTIKKPITIHEWSFHFVSRKWLYTAITRATHFDNVYFMVSDKTIQKDIEDKQNKAIWHYFKNKVSNYMKQDKNAGRDIRDECERNIYITINWLKNCINKNCGCCGNKFTIDIDDDYNVSSDITAQRIDNSLPHIIDNIEPMCIICNCSNK